LSHTGGRKNTENGSCNIVFLGDSLAHDHALAAVCQLLFIKDRKTNKYVYEVFSCNHPNFAADVGLCNPQHPDLYQH